MALIGNSDPKLYVEGSATQTGGSGNSRTVKITAKFKVNGSSNWYYGYPCNWRARVNSSYGSWTSIKGTETWNGGQSLRTFEQTLTVDVGTTSSKAITVGIYTDHPSYNYWNGSYTWTFNVGATNTAPSLSGTISVDPSGTVGENITKLNLLSPTASDSNLSGYKFSVSKNGGGYSDVGTSAGPALTHLITPDEGDTYKYSCYAYDSMGANSSTVYSNTVTINKFTPDTLTGTSSMTYSTSTLSFAYAGANNTSGNTEFSRTFSCSEVKLYNGTIGTGPTQPSVEIYKSGTLPTGMYIKFDDVKTLFASKAYQGTLTFAISTKNVYGSTKTSTMKVSVDLRTNPNGVTRQEISSVNNGTVGTESTIYKKVASSSNFYYVPDGSGVIRVKWAAGSGKLNETISYTIYVAYGSGGWEKLSDLTGSTLYYDHKVPVQKVQQQIKYLIRTTTSYGYYTDSVTPAKTLEYYNPPNISNGAITRGATSAEVRFTVYTNTSIPNVGTVGTWNRYAKGTTTPSQENGTLSITQLEQSITIDPLTDDGQYDIVIVYNDNTGFTTQSSINPHTIAVGANSPIFFVNKYGVGVNGLKATADESLRIKGSMGFTSVDGSSSAGQIKIVNGNSNGLGMILQSAALMMIGAGESPTAVYDAESISPTTESMYITADNNIYFKTNCNTIGNRVTTFIDTSGNLNMVGKITTSKSTGTYLAGNKGDALLNSTVKAGGYVMFNRYQSTNGYFTTGGYQGKWLLQYTTKDTVDAETNGVTSAITLLDESGESTFKKIQTSEWMMCKDIRLGRDQGTNGVLLGNISKQSNHVLRLTAGSGNQTMDIGPQNSSWCHFDTSVPAFYFYKPICVGTTDSYGALIRNETGNNDWSTTALFRYGCRAYYGIGSDSTSIAYPAIEQWKQNATSFTARMEVKEDRWRYIKNVSGSPAANIWVDSGGHGGMAIGSASTTYLKWLRDTTQLQVRNYADNAYTQIVASAFTPSSKREFKQDIVDTDVEQDIRVLKDTVIRKYRLKQEVEEYERIYSSALEQGIELEIDVTEPQIKHGVIIEELTPEASTVLKPNNTEGIDLYTMTSVLWSVCKTQQDKIERLENELSIIKKHLGL